MDRKIRVGAVNYLNTKPLIFGLEKGLLKDQLTMEVDFPANIATSLLEGSIDIGLVPVSILPRLNEYHFITDFGICCDGAVASVCLFSEVPIEEITEVLLDYQSRTSVRLARILMKEYWKINPTVTDTRDDFRRRIKGSTGGVVIGDRALEQRGRSKYVYDLGEAWKVMTGLPFVFACWVSNKPIDPEFIKAFSAANEYGLNRLSEVIAEHPYPAYDLHKYYTEDICYRLDNEKLKGLKLYLEYLEKFGL